MTPTPDHAALMTYEEFERIGMSEGAPYALCKLAWQWKPWQELPLHKRALRMMFRETIKALPRNALASLKFVSSFELQLGTLEKIADNWMRDYKSKTGISHEKPL